MITLSIGPDSEGGLKYERSFYGNGWRNSHIGTIKSTGATYTISFGGTSERPGAGDPESLLRDVGYEPRKDVKRSKFVGESRPDAVQRVYGVSLPFNY